MVIPGLDAYYSTESTLARADYLQIRTKSRSIRDRTERPHHSAPDVIECFLSTRGNGIQPRYRPSLLRPDGVGESWWRPGHYDCTYIDTPVRPSLPPNLLPPSPGLVQRHDTVCYQRAIPSRTVLADIVVHVLGTFCLFPLCSFRSLTTLQSTMINRTATNDDLVDAKTAFIQTHGIPVMRAVLFGFAGVAPRSAMPNLIELLSTMITRFPAESKLWMTNILFAVGVVPH